MNKLKEPVIFTIKGTAFLVNIDQQVLRQTDNSANEIFFVREMTDFGSHYRLFYDPAIRNVPHHSYEPATMKEIHVPPLIELDPEGMAAKYGFKTEDLKGKTDFQVMVD